MSNSAALGRSASPPDRLGERYELQDLLGRGGMASVHRVHDRVSGRTVALKQLTLAQDTAEYSAMAGMFEREFHTLAQLRHPHVIEVYDYGLLADGSPFYTMELLDGGDLRECAPLPWRDACRLLFDVCSSLALVHSRRLLHRDISPRNIHRTRDGHAKLIDFGALTVMGPGGGDVVGTPAFVAPETVHRLALDARTDLYSLGVTFYHALTASLPYPARSFSEVLSAWGDPVRPPSAIVADIPAALDDLVLALIAIDPALRPKSAFEVMQRMAAIAGLPLDESAEVWRAYLSTPALVGREALLSRFRERLLAARMGRSGALLIEGAPGSGRSRALDVCALEAKTLGFTVLRASAGGARARFSVVRDLTQHLLEALPGGAPARAAPELFEPLPADNDNAVVAQLRDFAQLDPDQVQQSVLKCWTAAGREQPLLLAIDDVQRIDAASAAVLAALIDSRRHGRTYIALSALRDDPDNEALHALARRCTVLPLEPLTAAQTHDLLCSVFGDVANLAMLTREVQAVAAGNPRQCIELAQYLVDRNVIRYAAGNWCIPERLQAADLPASAAAAKRAQVDALTANARFLAECHALAFFEELRDRDYRALLPEVPRQDIERALSELMIAGVVLSDGPLRRVSDRIWATALVGELAPDALLLRHRALARMYGQASAPTAFIHHAFAGELDEEAHAALERFNTEYLIKGTNNPEIFELDVGKMMGCYPRALQSAERLGFAPRRMTELWRWQMLGTTTMQHAQVPACARLLRAQLEHDSGLDLYRAARDSSDTSQRLMLALSGAQERYLKTPEAERVYNPEEAVRYLASYVVSCIGLGGRAHEYELLHSLPELIEPFASLAPLLDAVYNNALASCASSDGAVESARERWIAVWNQLQTMSSTTMTYVTAMSNAIAFAIGMTEAHLGLPSANDWADRLDSDPYQRVSALQLRRIMRLMQGDVAGAERFRRQAEVLELQSRAPQMFKALLAIELTACAKAGDLAGLQEALERIRALAQHYPGWQPNLLGGEASFNLARGDYAGAKRSAQACLALAELDAHGKSKNIVMWFAAHVLLAEALIGLGECEEARAVATRAIEMYTTRNIGGPSAEILRVLSLAEAKLGQPEAALARLTACIDEQTRLGTTGVHLGMLYEACAQIAILKQDGSSFARYAELVAREYRRGSSSGLSARYERLINEATRRGVYEPPMPDAPEPRSNHDWSDLVTRTMARAQHANDRMMAALQIICNSRNVSSGQLYLAKPAGLILAAMQGQAPLPPVTKVRDYIESIGARSDDLDDMTTDAASEEPESTTIHSESEAYVLLPLACVQNGQQVVVGAVAVAHSELTVDRARENQLLNLIAAHLLGNNSLIATTDSDS